MKSVLNILLALTAVVATTVLSGQLTMPPSFTERDGPETVLRAYPLGQITKQAAYSHHGKAVRTKTLPNGLEGWVYEVGGKQARTYQHPTMKKQTVFETGQGNGVRTFTLVFDGKGVVIDVLYNEQGRHDGLTALQEQRKVRGDGTDKH